MIDRLGIRKYVKDEVKFENLPTTPAMQIKSHVAYIKKVSAGDTVGYGAAFMAKRETLVATIPCGYGDCYPRLLTNKGRVLIKGHSAPVIGRVCMDQFMVDVTHIPGVQRGDTVSLLDDHVSILWMANLLDVNVDEIVCNISKRVPRVYQN